MSNNGGKSSLGVPAASFTLANMPTPQMSPVREEIVNGGLNKSQDIFGKSQAGTKRQPVELEFVEPTLEDLDEIHRLEALSYPEDEAASRTTLEYRIKNAQPYFLVGVNKETKELMGFVCGTASELDELKHSTMFVHIPDGTTLNIHSVVCNPEFRRRGVASAVLKALIEKIRKDQKIKLLCLICKPDLINFYEQCGFELIGPSSVVHGQDKWFEMRMRLKNYDNEKPLK